MIDMENDAWARMIFAMEEIASHLATIRLMLELRE